MGILDKIDVFFLADKPRVKWYDKYFFYGLITALQWLILALFIYGLIYPVLDLATFLSYWLWVFIIIAANSLIGELMRDRCRIASCIVLLGVFVFAYLYIFNISIRCGFYNKFLPLEENTKNYCEMLYVQVKNDDYENIVDITHSMDEWLDKLSEKDRKIVEMTYNSWCEEHPYKGAIVNDYLIRQ